jgi:hypothetical protein
MAMPQPIMPWLQQQQGMNQYNPMFSGMGLGGSMMGNRGYGQQRSGQGGTALGLRDLPPLNIPTLPTRDNPLGLPEMPPSDLTNPEWPIPSGPVLPKQEKDPPIDLGPLTPDYLKNPPQYERPWFVPKPWGKPYEGMPGQWGGGQWGPYTF